MKKLISLLLLICMAVFTYGCEGKAQEQNAVQLYYPTHQVTYGELSGLISSENVRRTDAPVEAVLQSYLKGPTDLTLRNPFPYNVQLISVKQKETVTTLMLSDEFAALSGIDLTIACTCLAKTTFSLTGATSVAITCQTQPIDGEQILVFSADGLLFLDESTGPAENQTDPTIEE